MFMILLILLLLDGIYMKNNNATLNHNQNWWKLRLVRVFSWRKLKQFEIEIIKKQFSFYSRNWERTQIDTQNISNHMRIIEQLKLF